MWLDYIPLITLLLAIIPVIAGIRYGWNRRVVWVLVLVVSSILIDLVGIALARRGVNNLFVGKIAAAWFVICVSMILMETRRNTFILTMILVTGISFLLENNKEFGILVRPTKALLVLVMGTMLLLNEDTRRLHLLDPKVYVPIFCIPYGLIAFTLSFGGVLMYLSRTQGEIIWSIKILNELILTGVLSISTLRHG